MRLNTPYVKYPGVLKFNIQSFKEIPPRRIFNAVENPFEATCKSSKGLRGKGTADQRNGVFLTYLLGYYHDLHMQPELENKTSRLSFHASNLLHPTASNLQR